MVNLPPALKSSHKTICQQRDDPKSWIDNLIVAIRDSSEKEARKNARCSVLLKDVFTSSQVRPKQHPITASFSRVQDLTDCEAVVYQAQCILASFFGLQAASTRKEGFNAWAYRGYFLNAIIEVCLQLTLT
jgi:hypothetical protein